MIQLIQMAIDIIFMKADHRMGRILQYPPGDEADSADSVNNK